MSVETTGEVFQAYADAIVTRGEFGRFMTEDVTFEIVGSDIAAQGREAVEQTIRELHERAFDAKIEVTNAIVADGKAAVEARFVGTHIGAFADIEPTHAEVSAPYSVFYEFRDDRVCALRLYFPLEQLHDQLTKAAKAEAVPA